MHNEPLDILPLWSLLLFAVAFLSLAIEGGYRLGKWRHIKKPDERDAPVGAMVASILGLLALVLGFTFSLAASRFDARRQAVLEEANAIGTTYLRARLLPEPHAAESARLLREYVDVRVRGVLEQKVEQAVARSEVLHELLWAQTAAAAEKDPHSMTTALFIQSLNNVIDMHREIEILLKNLRRNTEKTLRESITFTLDNRRPTHCSLLCAKRRSSHRSFNNYAIARGATFNLRHYFCPETLVAGLPPNSSPPPVLKSGSRN